MKGQDKDFINHAMPISDCVFAGKRKKKFYKSDVHDLNKLASRSDDIANNMNKPTM